jgi:hypothetical protein
MPDRIFRIRPGQRLIYRAAFKRHREDGHAIPLDAPAVHEATVAFTGLASGPPDRVRVEIGEDAREIEIGDSLLEAYGTIRELAGDQAPEGCALILTLRES